MQNITITPNQNNEHHCTCELLFSKNTPWAERILKEEEIYNLREALQAERCKLGDA